MNPAVTEMNVDRLIRVRDDITAEPSQFEMLDYVTAQYDERKEFCGTALCVAARAALDAGFIALRNTPRPGAPSTFYDVTDVGSPYGSTMHTLGAAALALTLTQAGRLFYLDSWPNDFWKPFMRAKTPLERASIAAKRIDRFIYTDGRE